LNITTFLPVLLTPDPVVLPIPPVLDEIVAAIVVELSGYLSPARTLGRNIIHDEIGFVR
jgi:hypothetical protein